MTQQTFNLIHRSYQKSVESSSNILEITINLLDILSLENVPEEDIDSFDLFLVGLQRCIENRKKTFEMTNLVDEITFVIMYIIVWLNATRNLHIDINIGSRRKSLESELAKILKKSCSNSSATIRDRFGLRGIILNPDKNATTLTFVVNDVVIEILSGTNKQRHDFSSWIESTDKADFITKTRIKSILSLPFKVDFIKNFIDEPKSDGYQSLHFTLILDRHSPILPDAQFEVQLRNTYMHNVAEIGSASHDEVYKASEEEEFFQQIFSIEDFSNVHVVGFTGYDSIETDIDGVHFPKSLINRRISSTLLC